MPPAHSRADHPRPAGGMWPTSPIPAPPVRPIAPTIIWIGTIQAVISDGRAPPADTAPAATARTTTPDASANIADLLRMVGLSRRRDRADRRRDRHGGRALGPRPADQQGESRAENEKDFSHCNLQRQAVAVIAHGDHVRSFAQRLDVQFGRTRGQPVHLLFIHIRRRRYPIWVSD